MFLLVCQKYPPSLTRKPFFSFADSTLAKALLYSQFHKTGTPSFKISPSLKKALSPHLAPLTTLQKQLNKSRNAVLKVSPELTL